MDTVIITNCYYHYYYCNSERIAIFILNYIVTIIEQFNRKQLWSVAAMIFGDYVLLPQTLTRGLTVSLYSFV